MQNGKRVKAESAKALARKNYSAYFSRTVFVHFSTCSSARAEKKSVFPPTGRITVDVATVMDAAKHTAVVDASLEKEHFPSSLPRRLDVVFFFSSSSSSSSSSLLLLLLLFFFFGGGGGVVARARAQKVSSLLSSPSFDNE